MASQRRSRVVLGAVLGTVGVLLVGGVFFLVFGVIYPPPGDPVAVTDVAPGRPFVAEWIADGYPKRAWLDFTCYGCGFPFRGSATIEANGVPCGTANIEVDSEGGYAVSGYEGGSENTRHGLLLFDVPALPAGARARITGVLSVPSPTIIWSSDPSRPPAPPSLPLLRFWVAR